MGAVPGAASEQNHQSQPSSSGRGRKQVVKRAKGVRPDEPVRSIHVHLLGSIDAWSASYHTAPQIPSAVCIHLAQSIRQAFPLCEKYLPQELTISRSHCGRRRHCSCYRRNSHRVVEGQPGWCIWETCTDHVLRCNALVAAPPTSSNRPGLLHLPGLKRWSSA